MRPAIALPVTSVVAAKPPATLRRIRLHGALEFSAGRLPGDPGERPDPPPARPTSAGGVGHPGAGSDAPDVRPALESGRTDRPAAQRPRARARGPRCRGAAGRTRNGSGLSR